MPTTPIPEAVPRARWAGALDRLTRAHAGRAASLEIDAPDLGAQRIADAPLWGVVHDPRADEIQILFGDFDAGRSRLVHAVPRPTAVEIHSGPDPRGAVLRVAWAGGQAILRVGDAR